MKTFTCIEAPNSLQYQTGKNSNSNKPKSNAARLRWMTVLNECILCAAPNFICIWIGKRVKNVNTHNCTIKRKKERKRKSTKEHKNATEFHFFVRWCLMGPFELLPVGLLLHTVCSSDCCSFELTALIACFALSIVCLSFHFILIFAIFPAVATAFHFLTKELNRKCIWFEVNDYFS